MVIGNEIEYYDYNKRIRNLDVESQDELKSQKFFPVFINDGKEEILKPLSKTKPLTTPFFSYSEVFWSRVINKYFYNSAPIYRLAICKNYSLNVPKYYDKGVVVSSVLNKNQKLVNLRQYFRENKDDKVDIDGYRNFCMQYYDYTSIFNSKIIKENQELGQNLAMQVLISILIADQNYHYENVNFIFKKDQLVNLSPPIDHEFSSMFLFLDDVEKNNRLIDSYLENFILQFDLSNLIGEELNSRRYYKYLSPITKNLDIITKRYPEVVSDFLQRLEIFITDFEKEKLEFVDSIYMEPFNTDNYKIGMYLYKKNDEKSAEKLKQIIPQKEIDLGKISKHVTMNILKVAISLRNNLYSRLDKNKKLEK